MDIPLVSALKVKMPVTGIFTILFRQPHNSLILFSTDCILHNSTILSEKTGDIVLNYYWANGHPAQIGYKNGAAAEVYYLVTHNAQGDVTALYLAPTSGAPTLVGYYLTTRGANVDKKNRPNRAILFTV